MPIEQTLLDSPLTQNWELFSELTEGFPADFQKRIHTAFKRGMARSCARPVWSEIAEALEQRWTERLVHGRVQKKQGITQEEWAEQLRTTQSTVCKWLACRTGAAVLDNIVLGMTAMDLRSFDLVDKQTRFTSGFEECLTHIQHKEKGLHGLIADFDVVHAVSELYRFSHGWFQAKKCRDRQERDQKLEIAARSISTAASEGAGRNIRYQTAAQFSQLESEWGAAWIVASHCIPQVV